MWFRIDNKRTCIGQAYVVRCVSEVSGQSITEERTAKGALAARKMAELLATTLNATATVYGRDAAGEFVHGVEDVAEGAASAASPLIKKLYAQSAAASLHFRDQLMADIPEDTIKGFAALSASLGYFVTEHRKAKRSAAPQVSYAALFSILCGPEPFASVTLPADDATIALLTRTLGDRPGWMWVPELKGLGSQQHKIIMNAARPSQVMLNIDGEA